MVVYYDRIAHVIPHSQEQWYYENGLMSHHSMRHYDSDNAEEMKKNCAEKGNLNMIIENMEEIKKYNSPPLNNPPQSQ